MQIAKDKIIRAVYLLAGLAAFAYVLIRAAHAGITYDENMTLHLFVREPVMNIINYTPTDANNHILNTLLIKLFFAPGSHDLFIARLPNVLALVLYLMAAYKITARYLSLGPGLCCYLLLLLNPFLLDFFSIARGYGLAIAFETASLYFLLRYCSEQDARNILPALLLAALAVFSNFSLLNYWFITASIIVLLMISGRQYRSRKGVIYLVLAAGLVFAVLYEPIRKMTEQGKLYYGGKEDFYHDTLLSLAKYTMYSPFSSNAIVTCLNVFLGVLLISVAASMRRRAPLISAKNAVLGLLAGCVLAILAQHFLLGTLYVIDRAALFLYPLVILTLSFCWNVASRRWHAQLPACIVLILFGINFFQHANFYKTAIWYFDARTAAALKVLNDHGKIRNQKLRVDFSWPFEGSFGYYTHLNEYSFIRDVKGQTDSTGAPVPCDVYIHLGQSLEQGGYTTSDPKRFQGDWDTLVHYPEVHVIVYAAPQAVTQ